MRSIASCVFLFAMMSKAYSQTPLKESEKIASFCKIWGFLKYYHPEVAKGKLDWDKEFMDRIDKISRLKTKQQLSAYYLNWISSLGKIGYCKTCNNNIPENLKFNLDLRWTANSALFTDKLTGKLVYIKKNRNQGKNHYVQAQMIAGNPIFSNEKPYTDSVFPSAALRLLSLSRYWNIINYFFPYKYLIGEDWNKALVEMIPKFKDAKDTTAYHLAMLELINKIHDGHAGFNTEYINKYFGLKMPPFRFKIIEDKVYVVELYNDSLCIKNDIRKGDVFLSIDNVDIKEIIGTGSKSGAALNEAVKYRKHISLIFNGNTDSVITRFERDGFISEKIVYRYLFTDFNYQWTTKKNTDDTTKIINGNIGYVNMGLLMPKQVNKVMDEFKKNKAIIFDVRNYPNGTMFYIANSLNSESKAFAKFTKPDMSYPGVYQFMKPYFCGKKNESPYNGKVILLFDERTQSHAEFTLMALQTAPNVTSIGSHTAGADGNVSLVTFPGNYQSHISGIGIYYPDGRETQRIGIIPDIVVKPTIEGLRAGKDELLDKAIEIINKD